MGIAHPCTFSLAIQDAVDVVTHQDKDRRRITCLSTKTERKTYGLYLDEHLFDQESAQKPGQSLQSCLLTESAGRPRQCSEFSYRGMLSNPRVA